MRIDDFEEPVCIAQADTIEPGAAHRQRMMMHADEHMLCRVPPQLRCEGFEPSCPEPARIFARHGTGADEAVMAGNSMKSDVLPALEDGAWAVHIPYAITWAHELADAPEGHPRFGALDSIADLPAWIDERA